MRLDITAWKDPVTKEFITRKEYVKLAKRATVKELSTPNYLTSLGYLRDQYSYYKYKDQMSLELRLNQHKEDTWTGANGNANTK